MTLFNQVFPNKICINLESRPDRAQHAYDQFENQNVLNVERFNAIDSSRFNNGMNPIYQAELACSFSHIDCIKLAKQKGLESIVVFEDDVVFENDFNKMFESYWPQVPKNWDILFLGHQALEKPIKITDNVCKVEKCVLMHAYCINSRIYENIERFYMSKLNDLFQTRKDGFIEYDYDKSIALDYLLGNNLKSYNAYILAPSLAYQNSDYSDIQKKFVYAKGN